MGREDSTLAGAAITPFALWLRTGRWVPAQVDDPTFEVKFNPNHAPKDGRFTSGPGGASAGKSRRPVQRRAPVRRDGRWGGDGFSGGGGGTFGGAGASGDGYWMNKAEIRAFHQGHPDLNPYMAQPGETLDQIAVDHHVPIARLRQLNGLTSEAAVAAVAAVAAGQVIALPRVAASKGDEVRHVSRNDYDFGIDAGGRTQEAKGELHVAETIQRSKANQRQAGGADRRATDDGGHFIAARFDGPSDSFNHFAQDANFNRGGYRAIEDGWAKDFREGKHVSVDITAHYPGTSKRPDKLTIKWSVNRLSKSHDFYNGLKVKKHGR